MCGSLLSKFRKPSNRIQASSTTGFQDPRGETELTDEPTEVRICSPVKKMLEELKNPTIKASRSIKKRAENNISESKVKKAPAKNEVVVATADLETDGSRVRLPSFQQEVKNSRSTKKCNDNSCCESKAEAGDTEGPAAIMTVDSPAERSGMLPPIYRPTIDIKKVNEVVANDKARVQKTSKKVVKKKSAKGKQHKEKFSPKIIAKAKSSREKMAKEFLSKEKLYKDKFTIENLAKGKLSKEKLAIKPLTKEKRHIEKQSSKAKQYNKKLAREKIAAIQGGPSSSSNTVATKPISSARSILLGKTKRAIAFEVLVGSKHKETVLLSARVPRRLRRFDNPPQLTAEVMTAKQLAAQEKRFKELERVRDCARACARPAGRNTVI